MPPTVPNRMQLHWQEVGPFLKREWPRLTDVDLEEIGGEYDRLVHRIKDLYGGFTEITQEAGVKGRIQDFLNDLEKPIS